MYLFSVLMIDLEVSYVFFVLLDCCWMSLVVLCESAFVLICVLCRRVVFCLCVSGVALVFLIARTCSPCCFSLLFEFA